MLNRLVAVRVANFKRQPRVANHATPQHQRMAARLSAAALRILHRPDFAVGHNGRMHACADVGDAVPVRRRAVAIGAGAGMDHDFAGAAFLQGQRAFFSAAVVQKAQTHFG